MSVRFEFSLSDKDFDRLMYHKNNVANKQDLNGNEYAEILLENLLHKICPVVPDEYYEE